MSRTTAPGEPGTEEPTPGLKRLEASLSDCPMRARPGPPVYPPASEAAPGSARLRAALTAPNPARVRRDPTRKGPDRMETYDVEGTNGLPVTVTRNIETGDMRVHS